MIDDRETCDVCGEEFNETRPFHKHAVKQPHAHKHKKPTKPKGETASANAKKRY